MFRWPLSDVEKSRPRKHSLCITRKALGLLALFLCKQFSLCFSLVVFFQYFNASHWMDKCRRQWLNFRGISFRYWWEPAKQYNISRVYLHLSTKLSQKCLKRIKIVFWTWFQVVLGGFRWMEVPCFDNDLSRRRNARQSEFLTEFLTKFPPKLRFFQTS